MADITDTLTLSCPTFEAGQVIPSQYTCDGENISPPICWWGAPKTAQSLALIVDDPDASRGTWSHWLLYNIPPDWREIQEDMPDQSTPGWGILQGRNDFGEIGYGGPCPPGGDSHRYFFRLYALDTRLDDLGLGMTRDKFLKHIEGHILDQAEYIGRYQRAR
jgi:Raf kinase inhibitor-like YbhB/YbcL family protein